ncbi:MAG: hypothetical protein IKW19_07560, partial [Akkermansia sp.]|nr:hypothetical protein [Akkermansia sp.]
AHASFTAEEVAMLQSCDSLISENGAGRFLDIDLEAEPNPSLYKRVTEWCCAAMESRAWDASVRRSLHALMKSGATDEVEPSLLISACINADVPLLQLLVEKGLDPTRRYVESGMDFCLLDMVLMPSGVLFSKRMEFLDWLYARGVDINTVPSGHLYNCIKLDIEQGDDHATGLLVWFLRHGYTGISTEQSVQLLLGNEGSISTLQELIRDGILAQPGRDWLNAEFLYAQVSGYSSNPEAVRWLLSHGIEVNKVQGEMPESVLDGCLRILTYMQRGLDAETDSLVNGKIAELELLLAHGAVNTSATKELLPIDESLHEEVVALFRKHGIEILAGENPCNACCSPE